MSKTKKKSVVNNFNRVLFLKVKGTNKRAYVTDYQILEKIEGALKNYGWTIELGVLNSINVNSNTKKAIMTRKSKPALTVNLDACSYMFIRLGSKDSDIDKLSTLLSAFGL